MRLPLITLTTLIISTLSTPLPQQQKQQQQQATTTTSKFEDNIVIQVPINKLGEYISHLNKLLELVGSGSVSASPSPSPPTQSPSSVNINVPAGLGDFNVTAFFQNLVDASTNNNNNNAVVAGGSTTTSMKLV